MKVVFIIEKQRYPEEIKLGEICDTDFDNLSHLSLERFKYVTHLANH